MDVAYTSPALVLLINVSVGAFSTNTTSPIASLRVPYVVEPAAFLWVINVSAVLLLYIRTRLAVETLVAASKSASLESNLIILLIGYLLFTLIRESYRNKKTITISSVML